MPVTPVHVVVVTDCVDIAANELSAAIYQAAGHSPTVRVSPPVPVMPALSVINGNFALRLMAELYPPGTVFLVTLSPDRYRTPSVVGRCSTRDFVFLGRNTGVFDWLTRDFGCAELCTLEHLYDQTSDDYEAFPGKYVTAPLAARIAMGTPISSLGEPCRQDAIKRLPLKDGTIVHVDNFGVMKFTGYATLESGDRHTVIVNGHELTAVVGSRLMSHRDGDWVLYRGSSLSLFELGQARAPGAHGIGATVGDVISIAARPPRP